MFEVVWDVLGAVLGVVVERVRRRELLVVRGAARLRARHVQLAGALGGPEPQRQRLPIWNVADRLWAHLPELVHVDAHADVGAHESGSSRIPLARGDVFATGAHGVATDELVGRVRVLLPSDVPLEDHRPAIAERRRLGDEGIQVAKPVGRAVKRGYQLDARHDRVVRVGAHHERVGDAHEGLAARERESDGRR